jgi:glycosyltransferase involved in cell wall biosynthesis
MEPAERVSPIAKRKTRILFITSLLADRGGAEKNFCEVLLGLDREKFDPSALVFHGGEQSDLLRRQGIPIDVNGVTKLLSLHAIQKGREAIRRIKTERTDIVVTYHHDADIWGAVVARLAGVPRVISSRRDMGYQLERKHVWFYRLFPFLFDGFITVSNAVKGEIQRRDWIRPEKIRVIHNGIRPGIYDRSFDVQEIKQRLGIDPSKTVIGSVASFRPIKGQLYLVEAVKELVDRHKDLLVLFVGHDDSEYGRLVKKRIGETGLAEHFMFLGERSDIPEILSVFDVFVLSSVHEGFSNAVIEAMAAGKPVVAPDSGGNPEAVEHGKTGFLFTPCDSRSLAGMLSKLIGDINLRKSIGYEGKCKVDRCFRQVDMIRSNEAYFSPLPHGSGPAHG